MFFDKEDIFIDQSVTMIVWSKAFGIFMSTVTLKVAISPQATNLTRLAIILTQVINANVSLLWRYKQI